MRKILFILLMVLMSPGLYADGFKLMGGLNLLKYSARAQEGSFTWNYKLGVCVGAGFEFDLTESQKIAIEIDGFIVQKKGSRPEEGSSNVKWTYSLTTLRIPTLARFKPQTAFPLYLLGGSEFTIVLSHSADREVGEGKQQWDIKEFTKSFDLGFVLGCGFEMKIKEFQSLFVEGRFHYGSMNIRGDYEDFSSMRTHVLLFLVGIKTY